MNRHRCALETLAAYLDGLRTPIDGWQVALQMQQIARQALEPARQSRQPYMADCTWCGEAINPEPGGMHFCHNFPC